MICLRGGCNEEGIGLFALVTNNRTLSTDLSVSPRCWGRLEWIILGAIMDQLKVNQGIRPSQHGFTNGRSCLTNLISFYEKVICLVNEGQAVDVVYLDFSKAFDTVPHSTLVEKLAAHGLDRYTLCWAKTWLEGQAQRMVVNGVKSFW